MKLLTGVGIVDVDDLFPAIMLDEVENGLKVVRPHGYGILCRP